MSRRPSAPAGSVTDLAERLLAGDVRALARAISAVEEGTALAEGLLRELFPRTGAATVVGITGPPGAGKSSLVDRLVSRYRERDARTGVVAIDPSSAFSGGAILGDRVRMQGHANDPGVFIRSMATRGQLGGLARATSDAVDLLDAAGYDPVLLETVGVGQDEIDVVRAADVVAVVLVPGLGDDIQTIKAGILEIADLFVLNKADLAGADRLSAELDAMLALAGPGEGPPPEVFRTVATDGQGIAELERGIARLAERSAGRRQQRRHERAAARLREVLSERMMARLLARALPGGRWSRLVAEIAERRIDPYTAADRVLSGVDVAAPAKEDE